MIASFAILFASYHLLVRHSWLGRWLNGANIPGARPSPASRRARRERRPAERRRGERAQRLAFVRALVDDSGPVQAVIGGAMLIAGCAMAPNAC